MALTIYMLDGPRWKVCLETLVPDICTRVERLQLLRCMAPPVHVVDLPPNVCSSGTKSHPAVSKPEQVTIISLVYV